MRRSFPGQPQSTQSGATLVVALLVLVLIMMLGITVANTSSTQYKLAANLQFEDSAFNNAEAALATAEKWLATGNNFGNANFFTAQDTPGLLQAGATNAPFSMAWDSTDSVAAGTAARYTIQLMSTSNSLFGESSVLGAQRSKTCSSVNTYLVTGYGTFSRGAKKIVQSYFSTLNC